MSDASVPKTGRPPGPGRGHRTKAGNGAGGVGWGGPAKGAGKPKRTIEEAQALKATLSAEAKEAKSERKEASREEMLSVYEDVARDDKAPHMARIVAADKWLDRHEGKPVQTSVNEHTLRTPASAADDAALLAIALSGGGAPAISPVHPGGFGNMVPRGTA